MTDRRPAPAAPAPAPATAPATAAPVDPMVHHVAGEIRALANGRHTNPHQVLGLHGDLVRAWRPDAMAVAVVLPDGARVTADRVHDAGLFEAVVPPAAAAAGYQLDVTYESGTFTVDDPYRFWPTLGDLDLYLYGEGRHETLWRVMGAHLREHQGVAGASFAVWAPSAQGGAGGGRLQRLGRPHAPHAHARVVGGVGAVHPRGRGRPALQVRAGGGGRVAHPQDRPLRLRHRGAAEHGRHHRHRGHPHAGPTRSGWSGGPPPTP